MKYEVATNSRDGIRQPPVMQRHGRQQTCLAAVARSTLVVKYLTVNHICCAVRRLQIAASNQPPACARLTDMATSHDVAVRALGRLARTVGQWVDSVGVSLQGKEAYIERRKLCECGLQLRNLTPTLSQLCLLLV